MLKKVIVIIKGGIGNQLFCYAAAKRLAINSKSTLVIDKSTGFKRDFKYKRHYALKHFSIKEKFASKLERFFPFSRIVYKFLYLCSLFLKFEKRLFIRQEGNDFDARLLKLKVKRMLYLDGYWQSELYFKDIEDIIHQDLQIIPPTDSKNKEIAEIIMCRNAVCIHLRWFDNPLSHTLENNIGKDFYIKAISYITEKLNDFHFFIFSDYPKETKAYLDLPSFRTTFINHNQGEENAYADLWLMSLCKHFIIANSTFSWWGAWLAKNKDKIVIAPADKKNGISSWGFLGLLPDNWIKL